MTDGVHQKKTNMDWKHSAARYVAAVEGERIGNPEFDIIKLRRFMVNEDKRTLSYPWPRDLLQL